MTDKEAIKGLQNIVEYWTLNPHEQDVALHAILALQEREKQEKGCECCLNTPEDVAKILGRNYCSKCGRKLKGGRQRWIN